MGRIETINSHYAGYDEDVRLDTRWGMLEEATTWKYIDSAITHIQCGNREKTLDIIDLGAGTGRYSLTLAGLGHRVVAVDLVEGNLDILRRNASASGIQLEVERGDATDLQKYPNSSFDVVLCLGPLYHLFDNDSINRAISEASRICRPGGFVLFAYLTQDSIMISYFISFISN